MPVEIATEPEPPAVEPPAPDLTTTPADENDVDDGAALVCAVNVYPDVMPNVYPDVI